MLFRSGMIVVNAKRLPANQEEFSSGTNGSEEFTSEVDDVYSTMFNKFNTVKPDSDRLETFLPETAETGTSKLGNANQSGNELLSITLFHDADFRGFWLDSIELLCSHMHDFNAKNVLKIANKYPDNPQLWRKFNSAHCEFF